MAGQNWTGSLRLDTAKAAAISLSLLLAAGPLFFSFSNDTGLWNQASAQTASELVQGNATETRQQQDSAVDTFFAQGSINQLLSGALSSQEALSQIFIMGGEWTLSVKEGEVRDFSARIIMTAEDGTRLHVHTIENLTDVTASASQIDVNRSSITLSNKSVAFSGRADITTNGVTEWRDVIVTIAISDGNVISIIPNPGEVQHFGGLPIYGLVTSLVDESGEPLATESPLYYHGRGEDGVTDVDETNATSIRDQPTLSIPYPEVPIESPMLRSNATELPIVEKLSDQETYLVQLRWAQSSILPLPGINYQLFLLDPDQPHATEEIVPPFESNLTAQSRVNASVIIQPEIILNFEVVESYDITVYSSSGSILWQKDDQPVYGGRDNGLITFEERYRGPIVVEISDIKPGIQDRPVDSVTFTSFSIR